MIVLVIMIAEFFFFLISNIELKVVSVRIGHFKCDLLIVILSKVLFFKVNLLIVIQTIFQFSNLKKMKLKTYLLSFI